jgi:hypothetical protein
MSLKINFLNVSLIILCLLCSIKGKAICEQRQNSGNRYLNIGIILVDTVTKEQKLIFQLKKEGSQQILRISFNGNEGNNGTLKIFNTKGDLVKEAHFELIKTPYYASVDVTNLKPGIYSLILKTTAGEHTSSIIFP